MSSSIITLPIHPREALDNSIAGTMNRCARLAFYNYALDRSPIVRNYPISFGQAYHIYRETLEKLYLSEVLEKGGSLGDLAKAMSIVAFKTATKDWVDPPVEHKKGYLDLTRLRKTCEFSFANWLQEKEAGYIKVIATESPFQLELPGVWRCSGWRWCDYLWYQEDSPTPNWMCPNCGRPLETRRFLGKLDQILEWNGRLWIRDFKTTSRKVDFNKKYNPDHQFTGYTWAAQKLSNRSIDGAWIDIIYNTKTKGPESYPTLATRSAGDIEHWLEWIHDSFSEWESRIRSGIWPMNTTECDHFGECTFREACNSGDWFAISTWLEAKTVHSVWDPLNPEDEEGLPES